MRHYLKDTPCWTRTNSTLYPNYLQLRNRAFRTTFFYLTAFTQGIFTFELPVYHQNNDGAPGEIRTPDPWFRKKKKN